MVVGFDVYHGGGRSVGAMAASVTQTLAKYYSTITSQEADMEMSAKIGAAFERKLKFVFFCFIVQFVFSFIFARTFVIVIVILLFQGV